MATGVEKFPSVSEIPWDKIGDIKDSGDKENYSFEFEIGGRRQRLTIGISEGQTSFTLSGLDGKPIVHASQKGDEITVLDFETKPSLPAWVKKLQKK